MPVTPLSWRERAGLALLTLAVLLPGTIGVSLVDRDEGWYAQTAREMFLSGDWIVPTYQGEPWIAKPPLLYWLIAAAYQFLGTHALAARLPSMLAMALAVTLLADLAARLLGRRAAWFAAATLITAGLPTVVGRMVLTDSLLLVCIMAACHALWRWAGEHASWRSAAIFWLMIGLGLLTKGPAIVVFVGPFALGLFLTRRFRRRLLDWRLGAALPLAIAVAAPWYVLAAQRAGGVLADQFFGQEILQRFTAPPHGHTGPPGYYLLFSLAGLLPWTALAPGAVFEAWRRRHEPAFCLLLVWLITPWVFLELIPGKLPHYILPCYAPLAILMGGMWATGVDAALSAAQRRVLRLWAGVPIAIGGLIIGGILAAGAPRELWGGLAAGAALIAGFTFVIRCVGNGRLRTGFVAAGISMTAATGIAGGWLLPALEPLRLSRRIAEAANELNPHGAPVLVRGYDEPTLFFYLDAPGRAVNSEHLKATPPDATPGRVLIITENLMNETGFEPQESASRRRLEGVNYVHGARVAVWIIADP